MSGLDDLKTLAEYALRVYRVVQNLPPHRQLEVMALANTAVNVMAQRALRPEEPQDE